MSISELFLRVVFVGIVWTVLIPTSDTPAASYVWMLDPSGWGNATVFKTPRVRVNSPLPTT